MLSYVLRIQGFVMVAHKSTGNVMMTTSTSDIYTVYIIYIFGFTTFGHHPDPVDYMSYDAG